MKAKYILIFVGIAVAFVVALGAGIAVVKSVKKGPVTEVATADELILALSKGGTVKLKAAEIRHKRLRRQAVVNRAYRMGKGV